MAVQLEQDIMEAIGLGANYNWYNGSGSCEYIRRKAAESLSQAIQKAHDEGKDIAEPNGVLIQLAKQADDTDRYVLTKTWQACATIIQAHIYAFHARDVTEEAKIWSSFQKGIEDNYLGDRQARYMDRMNINGFGGWRD